jgi:hypothetical protein
MAMEHQHFVRGGLEPERKIMSRKKTGITYQIFLEATISGTMIATCWRLGVGDNTPPIYLLLHILHTGHNTKKTGRTKGRIIHSQPCDSPF